MKNVDYFAEVVSVRYHENIILLCYHYCQIGNLMLLLIQHKP